MPDGSSAANGNQFVFLDSGFMDQPMDVAGIQEWVPLECRTTSTRMTSRMRPGRQCLKRLRAT